MVKQLKHKLEIHIKNKHIFDSHVQERIHLKQLEMVNKFLRLIRESKV